MSVPLLADVAVLLVVIAVVEVVAVSVFDALGICSGVALLWPLDVGVPFVSSSVAFPVSSCLLRSQRFLGSVSLCQILLLSSFPESLDFLLVPGVILISIFSSSFSKSSCLSNSWSQDMWLSLSSDS